MVEIRTSTVLPRSLMLKRPSCGRRFSEISRPDISFRRSTSAVAILRVGLGLHVQHAVDAEADRSDFSCGSMWMSEARVFCASSNTVCNSLTTGASSAPGARLEPAAELDRNVAHLLRQIFRQAGDFLGAAIQAVEQGQQLAFGNHGEIDVAPDDAGKFVESGQVGGVGHADAQHATALVQHQCAEAARLCFRQQFHQFGLGLEDLEVDIFRAKLACQGFRDAFFGSVAGFDQHATQLAAAAFLRVEGELELLVGNDALLHQQVAKSNLLWSCHEAFRAIR